MFIQSKFLLIQFKNMIQIWWLLRNLSGKQFQPITDLMIFLSEFSIYVQFNFTFLWLSRDDEVFFLLNSSMKLWCRPQQNNMNTTAMTVCYVVHRPFVNNFIHWLHCTYTSNHVKANFFLTLVFFCFFFLAWLGLAVFCLF